MNLFKKINKLSIPRYSDIAAKSRLRQEVIKVKQGHKDVALSQ